MADPTGVPEEAETPLPVEAERLLHAAGAPPRLLAHARLVCGTAARLLDLLERRRPGLGADRGAVLFGAAVHDIGKTVHPAELTAPGHLHERAGEELLTGLGVPAHLARFCRTHGDWDRDGVPLEDLLVALADKVWKGARVEALETRVVRTAAAAHALPAWEVFAELDDVLSELASGAEERIAYQTRHPAAR
ncbi:HD domain-containing protein [Nocardiopsis potens]|uniref:HD domain-containing protein n=1 Tax=Nocardiopsis potens TaxID=1246458 RepID=UPI00034B1608|nr:HD domain-containing protein [Nocardiopsis potens]